MKIRTLVVFVVVALLAATVGYAQSTRMLTANIPFEFSVGTKILPAGEYEVLPGVAFGVVLLRCTGQNAAAVTLSNPVQANRAPEGSKLVFNRYGSSYFLSQIWHQGINRGHELRKTKTEREMARNAPRTELAFVRATAR